MIPNATAVRSELILFRAILRIEAELERMAPGQVSLLLKITC